MNIEEAIKLIKSLKVDYNKEQGKGDLAEGIAEMIIDFDDIEAIETLLTAYEKEKEKNKLLEDNYSSAHEDINWFCENYISKKESEQKERKAYIKGTNDADELCNKKWEDKIKAKTEELERQEKEEPDAFLCKKVLQSLLEKE